MFASTVIEYELGLLHIHSIIDFLVLQPEHWRWEWPGTRLPNKYFNVNYEVFIEVSIEC